MTLLTEDGFGETTGLVSARSDAEEKLSTRHGHSTGEMKASHQAFRQALLDLSEPST